MTGWSEVALDDLVDLFDHKRVPLSSRERATRSGPYPYYGAQGVIDHVDDFLFDGRYILIPEDGENLRSRKQPIAFFAEGKFWVNNHAHVVRAKPGIATDRFVQSAIEASDISGYLTGAAQPKFSQKNLRRMTLWVPSFAEQITISSVLDAFGDLIENNRRRIELLEEMARTIYREWFVQFRYPGHESVSLVDSSFGLIPGGWLLANLFDVAEVDFGFSFKSKQFAEAGPYPVIRIRDIPHGVTNTFTFEEPPERYRVADGDVLIGMDGNFHVTQWAGGEAWLNQRVTRLRARGEMTNRHLMLAVEGPIRDWNAAITGTTVAHLGKRHLQQIKIVVPPADVMGPASALLGDIEEQICRLKQQCRALEQIRDLLLPRLVTGRIDVSSLDLDGLVDAAVSYGEEDI